MDSRRRRGYNPFHQMAAAVRHGRQHLGSRRPGPPYSSATPYGTRRSGRDTRLATNRWP